MMKCQMHWKMTKVETSDESKTLDESKNYWQKSKPLTKDKKVKTKEI